MKATRLAQQTFQILYMWMTAMQRLLNMVGMWSPRTKIDFNATKCLYFNEIYQGRKVIQPDIDLILDVVQLKKAEPNITIQHLGIPVQLHQLCGSGERSGRLDDQGKYLPSIIQEVQDRTDEIVATDSLNRVNVLELLDSMVKAKALYACKLFQF